MSANGLIKWLMRLCVVLIVLSGVMSAGVAGGGSESTIAQSAAAGDSSRDSQDHRYMGYLRIYIVEPTSRYIDYSGTPYGFGFLGFAANQMITLNYTDTLSDAVTYTDTGMTADNIMAIAVLFNGKDEVGYSDPSQPDCPFVAHYVDATASAIPGQDGTDTASGAYTHTVFLEEVTSPG